MLLFILSPILLPQTSRHFLKDVSRQDRSASQVRPRTEKVYSGTFIADYPYTGQPIKSLHTRN